MLGRDAQRVEHAAKGPLAAQRDRFDMRRYVGQFVHPVVALGVAIDDPSSQQERLVRQFLIERRLSRAERADRKDRGVAVVVGALAQVEAHRVARAAQCVAEEKAPARTDRVRRERHHRGDLLGGQHVVVAGDGAALPGQCCDEQAQLVTERAMEPHLAKRAPDRFDAPLEFLLPARRNGDGERRPQQRRMARRLQV